MLFLYHSSQLKSTTVLPSKFLSIAHIFHYIDSLLLYFSYYRILGFVCMVIVLWTPVIVPLFPTIVQSWATHSSTKFAELACVIGLYASIMILITLWGKRIRGYQNPLKQYGLDLTSLPKVCISHKVLILYSSP